MRIKNILILLILQKSRVFDIFSFSNQISCSVLKFFTICELYVIKFCLLKAYCYIKNLLHLRNIN